MFTCSNSTTPRSIPRDSPDLAFLMSFVTSVGGVSAYSMRRSVPGLAAGLGVGSLFFLGGWQIMETPRETDPNTALSTGRGATSSHEMAHQMCLIGSLMFTGAMSYRASSNPYTGPGGAMLAALGAVSTIYHVDRMLEWRRWEEARVAEAEKLLRHHHALNLKESDGEESGPVQVR